MQQRTTSRGGTSSVTVSFDASSSRSSQAYPSTSNSTPNTQTGAAAHVRRGGRSRGRGARARSAQITSSPPSLVPPERSLLLATARAFSIAIDVAAAHPSSSRRTRMEYRARGAVVAAAAHRRRHGILLLRHFGCLIWAQPRHDHAREVRRRRRVGSRERASREIGDTYTGAGRTTSRIVRCRARTGFATQRMRYSVAGDARRLREATLCAFS